MSDVRFFQAVGDIGFGFLRKTEILIHAHMHKALKRGGDIYIVAPNVMHEQWKPEVEGTPFNLVTPYQLNDLPKLPALLLVDECYPEQLKAIFARAQQEKASFSVVDLLKKPKVPVQKVAPITHQVRRA